MSDLAIVCVDDEVIILESLKEQLRRSFGSKYIYEVAESVEEAWEVINELQEDGISIIIIVSDWLMPKIKGDEFLIQVHQKFPELIKIMLTGQADESAIQNAKENANLHACLDKPWTEQELKDVIGSAIK